MNQNVSDGERENERLTDREQEQRRPNSGGVGFRQYIRPQPNSVMPTMDQHSDGKIVSDERSNEKDQPYEDDIESLRSRSKSAIHPVEQNEPYNDSVHSDPPF